jgi:hypothetical protein
VAGARQHLQADEAAADLLLNQKPLALRQELQQ